MKQRIYFIALATSLAMTVAVLPAHGAGSNAKPSYSWTDKDGVRHFGDTVPPEYASQARAELNAQGVALREYPRQLSPAEAAEAQKAAAEKERRRQRDTYLLTTYTTVDDIEQLRDERIGLIDGQMEIARGSLASVGQRLETAQKRMLNFKPYSAAPNARRVPDQLAEEVVRALSERRSMMATLASREKDKSDLRAEFDADIDRYLELTRRPSR